MSKFYFKKVNNDGPCHTKAGWKEYMKMEGIETLDLIEAIQMKGSEFFYCTSFDEVGEVKNGCGWMCDNYSPRNGKNGRCRFSNNLYENGTEEITLTLKPSEMITSDMFRERFLMVAMITDVPNAAECVSKLFLDNGWMRSSKNPLIFKKGDKYKTLFPIYKPTDNSSIIFDVKFCYGTEMEELRKIAESVKTLK